MIGPGAPSALTAVINPSPRSNFKTLSEMFLEHTLDQADYGISG